MSDLKRSGKMRKKRAYDAWGRWSNPCGARRLKCLPRAELQVIFHQKANNCRNLVRKITGRAAARRTAPKLPRFIRVGPNARVRAAGTAQQHAASRPGLHSTAQRRTPRSQKQQKIQKKKCLVFAKSVWTLVGCEWRAEDLGNLHLPRAPGKIGGFIGGFIYNFRGLSIYRVKLPRVIRATLMTCSSFGSPRRCAPKIRHPMGLRHPVFLTQSLYYSHANTFLTLLIYWCCIIESCLTYEFCMSHI